MAGKKKSNTEKVEEAEAENEKKNKKTTKSKASTQEKREVKEKKSVKDKNEKPEKAPKVSKAKKDIDNKKDSKEKKETKKDVKQKEIKEKKGTKKDTKVAKKPDAPKPKKTSASKSKGTKESKVVHKKKIITAIRKIKINKKDKSETVLSDVKMNMKPKSKGKYVRFVCEAIASLETEEQLFVSFAKIREYIFKYIEEVKEPSRITLFARPTINSLVEEKLLVKKRDSYRFSTAGRHVVRPSEVPKRKQIREHETAESDYSEEEEQKTITTHSGRVSRKVLY